jgi:hypothetical protein
MATIAVAAQVPTTISSRWQHRYGRWRPAVQLTINLDVCQRQPDAMAFWLDYFALDLVDEREQRLSHARVYSDSDINFRFIRTLYLCYFFAGSVSIDRSLTAFEFDGVK